MKKYALLPGRLLNRALRGAIRGYQLTISPLLAVFDGVGGGCRFLPTCSQYCLEALEQHGTWRGGWLGLKRLGRCAPWGTPGYDPVPPRRDVFRVPPAADAAAAPDGSPAL